MVAIADSDALLVTQSRCRGADLLPTWQRSIEAQRAGNPAIASEKRLLAASFTQTAANIKRADHTTLDARNHQAPGSTIVVDSTKWRNPDT